MTSRGWKTLDAKEEMKLATPQRRVYLISEGWGLALSAIRGL